MLKKFRHFVVYILSLLYSVYGDGPYEFGAFENMELTKEIVEKEMVQLRDLIKYRDELTAFRRKSSLFLNQMNLRQSEEIKDISRSAVDSFSLITSSYSLKALFENLYPQQPNVTKLPAEEKDLISAMDGLLHLKDSYSWDIRASQRGELKSSALKFGIVRGAERLSPGDMLRLSLRATDIKRYDLAVEFLREVKRILDEEDFRLKNPIIVQIYNEAKTRTKELNERFRKKGALVGIDYAIHNSKLNDDLQDFGKTMRTEEKKPNTEDKENLSLRHRIEFHKRCGQKDETGLKKSPNTLSKIKCILLHRNDPFLKLGPVKTEVLSEDPYLVIFVDLLSAAEINFLVKYSKPRLSRKRVRSPGTVTTVKEVRNGERRPIVEKAVQCWIYDKEFDKTPPKGVNLSEVDPLNADEMYTFASEDYVVKEPILIKLSEKLSAISSLNTFKRFSSSGYQVTNYGLGGTCQSHLDPFGMMEGTPLPPSYLPLKKSGDMLATFMGWLNDDLQGGGGTAFLHPHVDLNVKPRKGSVLFWYSLNKAGIRDVRTMHGGCPVLKGSKWILNKWIYMYDNFLTYPCGLKPHEFIQPLSGHF